MCELAVLSFWCHGLLTLLESRAYIPHSVHKSSHLRRYNRRSESTRPTLRTLSVATFILLVFLVTAPHARADSLEDDSRISKTKALSMARVSGVTVVGETPSKIFRASSANAAVMAAGCGSTGFAPWGVWGSTSTGTCGVFGYPGFRRTYNWSVPWWSGAYICTQGRGFNSSRTQGWYGLGCGQRSWATIPWGNVLATPAARGYAYQSTGTFTWS